MRRRSVVLCILCLLSSPLPSATASETERQSRPSGNPDHIVLVESVRVIAVYSDTIHARDGIRQAWLRIDYPVPPDAPKDARRRWVYVLALFDCAADRWRSARRIEEPPAADAAEADREPGSPSWRPTAGSAAARATAQYVCSYSGPAREPGETIYLM